MGGMQDMTLRELLSYFTNKTIWVDLCTPIWRKCGEVRNIETELADSEWMNMKVFNWTYTNSLNIDM